ncbi:MAG TPA: DedA family protein, partial [Archangium sp.]|nr:DedA family protein [Archangium sp.]
LVVVGLGFFLWRKRLAAMRGATLDAAVKASPVSAHLLTGAEAQSAGGPVFVAENASTSDRVQVRD